MPETSFDGIRNLVREALNQGRELDKPSAYISELWHDRVVYYDDARKVGSLFRRNYIYDGEAITLDSTIEEVEAVTSYVVTDIAQFSIKPGEESEEFVKYSGVVFKPGKYPKRGLEMSLNECEQAAAEFSEQKGNYEHVSGILDGHLGSLKRVWIQDSALFGEYDVPKWLADKVGDSLKVSLEIHRKTKQICGVGLVLNPHVKEAELIAQFSESETRKGNSKPKMKGNILKKFLAFFSDLSESEIEELGKPGSDTQEQSELEKLREENEKLKADAAVQPAVMPDSIDDAASKFADDCIASKKAIPAERAELVAAFTELAGDVATFSNSAEPKAISVLRKLINSRTEHTLTSEVVPGSVAVFSEEKKSPDMQAVVNELLAMTPMGADALKKKGA